MFIWIRDMVMKVLVIGFIILSVIWLTDHPAQSAGAVNRGIDIGEGVVGGLFSFLTQLGQ